MFDIGFAELLIVAVVALVVLGPERLPVAARTVGLWVGRIRRTLGGIQSEISEELRLDEMKRTVAIKQEELEKELSDMRTPFNDALGGESPFATSASSPDELKSQQASSSAAPAEVGTSDTEGKTKT
ncbi:MAG: Sec-independent protein translocase protein TatB [Pontibacterium sp.]